MLSKPDLFSLLKGRASNLGCDALNFRNPGCCFRLIQQVALTQQDNGLDTGLVYHDQIAFQAAEIEIIIQGLNDKGNINIGGNELKINFFARSFSLEQGLAR